MLGGVLRRCLPVGVIVAALATTLAASQGSDGAASATVSAKAIAVGLSHSCALTGVGGVKCWGYNGHDELGDGAAAGRARPGDVSGLTGGVKAIAVGVRHSCALTSGGSVKCWGHNRHGQLGDGTSGRRRVPVDVSGLSSGVTAVAVGWDYSCALTSGGGVKCWGHNGSGRLGDGTTVDRWTPVDVSGLSSGVTAIAAGGGHSCALTRGGGVKCWGDNRAGELGDGTAIDRLTPVDVFGLGGGVTAISAGLGHSCALMSGGGVKCWGANGAGALGDGTTSNRNTPVDVVGLSGVRAIAAGAGDSCALTGSGGVKCWGLNDFGQLGDGTSTNRLAPVGVTGLSSGVTAIAVGSFHGCALVRGTGVKCWGLNGAGQLGDGTTGNRSTPVGVSGLGAAKATLAVVSSSVPVMPSRVAGIELRCGSQARCKGTLTLTASKQPRLGSRSFSIAAGRSQTVKVELTARAFKLLVRAKRLRTQVWIGRATAGTITLTAPRR